MRDSTKSAFETFDEALNLDRRERESAQDRHRTISEHLITSRLASSTFLQGSFARKTMLKPLKDVDMIILMHPDLTAKLRKPGGPAHAMNLLRQEVAQLFPGAQFDVEDSPAHALQVTFPDLDFTFDLVPALDEAGREDVFIADREEDTWEWSNTRTLNRTISTRNQATGGRFVHQVRMLKSLKKNHPVLDEICGLLWEALAYQTITVAMDHSEALATVIAHAAQAVTGPIVDPTGVDDLTANWTPAQRSAYVTALAPAARQAAEARRLEQDGDHPAAIDIWHDLIGDPFPTAPAQTADAALRALAAGSITSTGRAVTSLRAQQPARPSRSWRTC
ncbi:nucleotidyltransferase [Streptomyces sp. ISL-98]|uniref:nucleotidyltransferase domain-containing protein n=1 Tax=Streptomyces sp. ISL-98 TaxID=2819192 RepID=UPI001BE8325C|nr:nucleotidyltransferase [Streptomyces sp. ISL-98]MBT2508526.1 nucleotidyltransferase [Streptomyces sp. ISL-98]